MNSAVAAKERLASPGSCCVRARAFSKEHLRMTFSTTGSQRFFSILFLSFFVSSSWSLRIPLHHVTEEIDPRSSSSSPSPLLDRGRRHLQDTFNVLDVEDPSSLFSSSPSIYSLRGKPGLGYYVTMSFGTPPQHLNVLVDSGSSNLAVACAPDPFVDEFFSLRNSTSWEPTGTRVMVPYTQGKWEGDLVTEIVSVGRVEMEEEEEREEARRAEVLNERSTSADAASDDSNALRYEILDSHSPAISSSSSPTKNPVRFRANLACIETSSNFFINGSKWQGILGLGYALIARPSPEITPFLDSMTEANAIEKDLFALKLCGTMDTRHRTDVSMGGSLDLGLE